MKTNAYLSYSCPEIDVPAGHAVVSLLMPTEEAEAIATALKAGHERAKLSPPVANNGVTPAQVKAAAQRIIAASEELGAALADAAWITNQPLAEGSSP